MTEHANVQKLRWNVKNYSICRIDEKKNNRTECHQSYEQKHRKFLKWKMSWFSIKWLSCIFVFLFQHLCWWKWFVLVFWFDRILLNELLLSKKNLFDDYSCLTPNELNTQKKRNKKYTPEIWATILSIKVHDKITANKKIQAAKRFQFLTDRLIAECRSLYKEPTQFTEYWQIEKSKSDHS